MQGEEPQAILEIFLNRTTFYQLLLILYAGCMIDECQQK